MGVVVHAAQLLYSKNREESNNVPAPEENIKPSPAIHSNETDDDIPF